MVHNKISQEEGRNEEHEDNILSALGTIQNEDFKLEIMPLKRRRDRGKDAKAREISSAAITKHQRIVKRGETKKECMSFSTSANKSNPGHQRKFINRGGWRNKKTNDSVVMNGLVNY